MRRLKTWLVAAAVGGAAGAFAAGDPPVARGDRTRSAAPISGQWRGADYTWHFGYELTLGQRRNLDLDDTRDRDRRLRDQEATAALALRWSPTLDAALELKAVSERRRRPGTLQVRDGLQRGEMWLRVGAPADGLSLQAGRVPWVEPRGWWWDDDLDGLRLHWQGRDGSATLGLARELAASDSADGGIAPEQRGVTRVFAQAGRRLGGLHLDLFWLHQTDTSGQPAAGTPVSDDRQDSTDLDADWLGLRVGANGRFGDGGHRLAVWADLAWLQGRARVTGFDDTVAGTTASQRQRGHAVELGLQWRSPWPGSPGLVLAWARGSDGFRQTGLQENKQRWLGVKRFSRYGELLDPELANLQVLSIAAGLRPTRRSSVDLVWHRYALAQADQPLVDTRLSATPDGRHRDLGQAWDLLLAWREWEHASLTLTLSRFVPGPAFAPRDAARGVELGLDLAF